MKTKYYSDQHVQLAANSKPISYSILLTLKRWCNGIGKAFDRLANPDYEPKVWEKKNRNGTVYWNVYDPVLGYTARFSSELEVRLWLDQYFNRLLD